MRVCLLTGGGYPYRRDALGGWCRTLVEGLPGVTFDLLTVTDREPAAATAYALPPNVGLVRAAALSRDQCRRAGINNDAATAAAVPLCQGLLGEQEDADDLFADGLRRLAGLVPDGVLDPLAGVPLPDVLLDTWRTGRSSMRHDRLPLPRLKVRDARTVATLLRHAARALAVRPPCSDLVHCVGGTNPLLAALAGHWRNGTPVLLTEARAAGARWRPAEERLSPAVRTVLRRFRSAVARTGYAEAGLIAPLSAYHHGWAVQHGAQSDRLVSVPADSPDDLATACTDLLRAPHRRRALGEVARRRALACFTTDGVVRVYGALYADLAAPPPILRDPGHVVGDKSGTRG